MKGIKFVGLFVLVILAFVGLNCVLTKADSFVVRKGYVESIEDNVLKIIDTAGCVWEWEVGEGELFYRWDNVKMTMDNNNTTNTEKDDIILKIRLDK